MSFFFLGMQKQIIFPFIAWMRIVEVEFKSDLRIFVYFLKKANEMYLFFYNRRSKK